MRTTDWSLGDMTARFFIVDNGAVGWSLLPTERLHDVVVPRPDLTDEGLSPWPSGGQRPVDSLVQVALADDVRGGAFSSGRTLHNSAATTDLRFVDQQCDEASDGSLLVRTTLRSDRLVASHCLGWASGDQILTSVTTVRNVSDQAVTLDAVSSFSLQGITPFDSGFAPDRLRVHRFRTNWSAEGRLVTESIEDLGLERSWIGHSVSAERFGQVGTMPVRGWFPEVLVEDASAHVTWGVQLEVDASWQLELYRKHDDLVTSGGLPDVEFGSWSRTLRPGEEVSSPTARLTVTSGSVDDACQRLVAASARRQHASRPASREPGIVVNEYCTSWGQPSEDEVVAMADSVSSLAADGVRWLVVDAGWQHHATEPPNDWAPNPVVLPRGLDALLDDVRQRHLIPGLWFEPETVEKGSAWWNSDNLLTLGGTPVTCSARRFWDLREQAPREYLRWSVVDLIRDHGVGYVKVDYNETIGRGCDGADSPGAELRRQMWGVQAFWDELREIPGVFLENCASGGHRLSAPWVEGSDVSSFSDAHESPEIPLIAGSLHRLVPAGALGVWCTLRHDDDRRRRTYSLAAAHLGRMTLSGDLAALTPEAHADLANACRVFSTCWPVIRDGRSTIGGSIAGSWRAARGHQSVVRVADDQCLVVVHTFGQPPDTVAAELPPGRWSVVAELDGEHPGLMTVEGHAVRIAEPGPWCGWAVLLGR